MACFLPRYKQVQSNLPRLPFVIRQLQNVLRLGIGGIQICWSGCRRIFSLQQGVDTMELIEHYRQGPQQYDRWNFLLWRLTFPIFTLLVLLVVIFVGQLGGTVYTLVAAPLWYYVNFILEAYPFFLIYRYRNLNETFRTILWKLFAIASIVISIVEWVFSSKVDRFSWLIGNGIYAILALAALPLFFYTQERTVRVSTIKASEDVLKSPEPSPVRNKKPGLGALPEQEWGGNSIHSPRTNNSLQKDDSESQEVGLWTSRGTPNQSTYVLYLSGVSMFIVWLISWASYLSPPEKQSKGAYWDWLAILAPVLLLVILTEGRGKYVYNFEYLIFYGITTVHIPDFLGHLSLNVFALTEVEAGEHAPAWLIWMKLAISVMFLLIMQGYFHVLLRVVQNLSEPFAHPSLLYIGQLYYYMFWYMMVGNDAPIDRLYFGMLLLSNVHIVLANTGLYSDMWNCFTTTSCLSTIRSPFIICVGSSMAMCYSAREELNARTSMRKSSDSSGDEHENAPMLSQTHRNSSCEDIRSQSTFCCKKGDKAKDQPADLVDEQLKPLYFLMKMAEQDNMADTSALILVPTLLTTLAFLDAPAQGSAVLSDKIHLWLRCICMFLGRLCSSYLAQEIFAYKLKSRIRKGAKFMGDRNLSDMTVSRRLIQSIMLQDFQHQFWYLTAVTIVCTFACFERLEWPARFAFLKSF